jgi:hypothetical protein
MTDVQAQGFFVDRVVDAFSVDHLQNKFLDLYAALQKPPKMTATLILVT